MHFIMLSYFVPHHRRPLILFVNVILTLITVKDRARRMHIEYRYPVGEHIMKIYFVTEISGETYNENMNEN